jgi:lysophospholipase L1-like esterase
MKNTLLLCCALFGLMACDAAIETSSDPTHADTVEQQVVGAPSGSIPPGLPARLAVGLFENTGSTWMKNSATPWDVRYRYFTKGWVNNWGYGGTAGSFGLTYMNECAAQGQVPAIAYYQMQDEPGGGEGQFYAKVQNATTMASYFSDFKVLMQRAKDFNKPVVILLEADGYAFLEQQSGKNPNAYAAVAATGLPELAGLPNTVAGWGMAFLQIRKSVGATQAILGIHISGWESGVDLFHSSVTEPLQPHVDSVYNFLSKLGLAANQTGATYDVMVGDPLDRDADYYQLVRGENRWWDMSSSASVNSKSFNRYAEWLRLWNLKASKRWVLWQIPVGNSSSLNTCNSGGVRQGYKDNRTEYFFGANGPANREKFATNGVIALLFGRGEGCQSSYENDLDGTGQPYLKTHAGPFLQAGGLAIPAGAGGTTTTPTTTPTPTVDAGTAAPMVQTSLQTYDFETGVQGFTARGGFAVALSASTLRAYAGVQSLAVRVDSATSGKTQVGVSSPSVPQGATINFRVWLPLESQVSAVQAFAQEGSANGWRWTGSWKAATSLTRGAWNTITVVLPSNSGALASLGVELTVSGAVTTTAFVDSIGWGAGTITTPTTTTPTTTTPTPTATPDAGTPTTTPTTSGPAPTPTGCLRVMPLGDSITLGVNGGYRNNLRTSLTNAGCGVNFVGSLYDQYAVTGDKEHEGHSGFTISNIASNVDSWLGGYTPDYILLMIGTNDIAWWTAESASQIADRHAALVDQILAKRPNAWVIVASIPPITSKLIAPNNVDRAQLGRDLNTGIQSRMASRQAAGKRVRFADVYSTLSLADLYDGVHPTQAAHAKVATAFFGALSPVTACTAATICN